MTDQNQLLRELLAEIRANFVIDGYVTSAQMDKIAAALSHPAPAQPQAAQAVPELTDMQIKAAVYERTKLNPNQAADVELLQQITMAFRDLLRATKEQQ